MIGAHVDRLRLYNGVVLHVDLCIQYRNIKRLSVLYIYKLFLKINHQESVAVAVSVGHVVEQVRSRELNETYLQSWNFKESLGARKRGGIGLSYRPARLQRLALAEFIPWNRFLGSINV
jgi:hypothetical protein